MPATQPPVKASTALPLLYRLQLLVIEPLCSFNGAVMALRNPQDYAAKISRGFAPYDPADQHLYTQLAGAWLLFGLSEVLVLGLVDDLRVWKPLCAAMLASDVVYHVSSVQAVGGWERFARLGEWDAFAWAVFVSAVAPMVVRLLVVLGVGVKAQSPSPEERGGEGKKGE